MFLNKYWIIVLGILSKIENNIFKLNTFLTKSKVILIWILSDLIYEELATLIYEEPATPIYEEPATLIYEETTTLIYEESATLIDEEPAIPIPDTSHIIIEIGNQLIDFKHHAMVTSYRFDWNLL